MHGGGGGEAVTPTKGKRGGLKKTKVEIIPMIDTMFFLLVFFILSSIGQGKLTGINLQMPKLGGAPADPTTPEDPKNKPLDIMLNIKPDGAISVGSIPAAPTGGIPDLIVRQAIKDKQIFDGDQAAIERELKRAIVTVNADPRATHEMVVKAIDEARKIKRKTEDPDAEGKQDVGASIITQFSIANSAAEPDAPEAP